MSKMNVGIFEEKRPENGLRFSGKMQGTGWALTKILKSERLPVQSITPLIIYEKWCRSTHDASASELLSGSRVAIIIIVGVIIAHVTDTRVCGSSEKIYMYTYLIICICVCERFDVCKCVSFIINYRIIWLIGTEFSRGFSYDMVVSILHIMIHRKIIMK